MTKSLADQYAEKIATPRCRPRCDPRDWRELAPKGGVVKTVCGKCATWIGDRPVGGKGKPDLTTENAEGTELCEPTAKQ